MKALKRSIALFTAAMAVSAAAAMPISAQADLSSEPAKTYRFKLDALKSLMFQCNLDYNVKADEENGIITFSSKDGNECGEVFVTSVKLDDGTTVYPANVSVEGDAADIDDYREVFQVISRNSKRLADIVDDLLTLTNKNADLSLEAVSLPAMLREIVCDLEQKYRIKEVEVKYDFDGDMFIKCPEMLTYRLFANLIENAFKYNRQNGELIISVRQAENGYRVSIRDSGIGISEKELPHIWDAFYCVDSSRSKELGGTGLGLSVAKEIADRLGWELTAASVLGEGSEFIVLCKKITV